MESLLSYLILHLEVKCTLYQGLEERGGGGGGGGPDPDPDPAFPLLFHAIPASRTFCHRFAESRFSFLKNSFKKGLIFA